MIIVKFPLSDDPKRTQAQQQNPMEFGKFYLENFIIIITYINVKNMQSSNQILQNFS